MIEQRIEHSSNTSRLKHPNQYTYRTKAGSRTRLSPSKQSGKRGRTPNESTGTTPVLAAQTLPPLPGHPTHNHSKTRQFRGEPSAPIGANGWGLPDHLKHLQHLLPTFGPIPLEVPSSIESALEPPTRIRFPTKRITMSEMKKRAKHILDFMARIQIEMSEQERRNEVVAAAAVNPLPPRKSITPDAVSSEHDEGLGPSDRQTPDAVGAENLKMMNALTQVSFSPTLACVLCPVPDGLTILYDLIDRTSSCFSNDSLWMPNFCPPLSCSDSFFCSSLGLHQSVVI